MLVPHLSNLLPIFAGIYGEGTFLSMLAYGTNYGEWCAMTGSNRRPHACKAYALPAELIAHMELPVRFELTTYALLVRCSGQLSYGSIYKFYYAKNLEKKRLKLNPFGLSLGPKK